jgi:hypothetical protein
MEEGEEGEEGEKECCNDLPCCAYDVISLCIPCDPAAPIEYCENPCQFYAKVHYETQFTMFILIAIFAKFIIRKYNTKVTKVIH